MPYTHFQMIAYEVPTVTRPDDKSPWQSGWDAGAECANVARIPVPDDITDVDVRKRLKRLAKVVDYVKTWYDLLDDDNATTLKVFIAPEFYFRPPVIDATRYKYNTYPAPEMNKILQTLGTMFAHQDFAHWLFVCGTVLWNNLDDVKAARPLYFNTAAHVWGGPRDNPIGWVEKNLPSSMDGIPAATPLTIAPSDPVRAVFESQKTLRQRVFTVDAIPFGLEVCLDHRDSNTSRVLRRTLSGWPAWRTGVKLHVLTSGGMTIQPGSVCTQVGGYMMRNDGAVNPGDHSEFKQVQSYTDGLQTYNQFDAANPLKANLTEIRPATTYAIPAGPMRVPIPAGCRSFPQRLVVYPETPVPV